MVAVDRAGAVGREHLARVVVACAAGRDLVLEPHRRARSGTDDEGLCAAVPGVDGRPRASEDGPGCETSGGQKRCSDQRDDQGDHEDAIPNGAGRERVEAGRRPREARDERVVLSGDGHALGDRRQAAVPGALVRGLQQVLSELDGEAVVHHAICSRMRAGSRSSASIAARSALVARLSRDFVVPSGIPNACAASASGRSR